MENMKYRQTTGETGLRIPRGMFWLLACVIGFLIIGCYGPAPPKKIEPPGMKTPTQVAAIPQGLTTGGRFKAVCVADLDNDGLLDVAGGTAGPGSVAIWYGKAPGKFDTMISVPVRGDVLDITAGDADSNGLLDLFVSVQQENFGIFQIAQRPDRKWTVREGPPATQFYRGIEVADINNDGFMDIAAANRTSENRSGLQVWLGDGKGGWITQIGPTQQGLYMDVGIADFNEDGVLDIVGAGWGVDANLNMWLGTGGGGWSSVLKLAAGSYYGITVDDFNNDGHADILATTYRAGFNIFFGRGNGRFRFFSIPEDTGSYHTVLAMDMDGDGFKDIVAGSLENRGLRTWLFDGIDKFATIPELFPETGFYYAMVNDDLDGDGVADLTTAAFGDGVKIWLSGRSGALSQGNFNVGRLTVQQTPTDTDIIRENAVFTTAAGIDEYKIGPGDILEITFWKGTTGTREELAVRPDGRISFGYVEDLYVQGLTARQLDGVLSERLQEFIKVPRIDIRVTEFASKYVTILGAVGGWGGTGGGPGKYELTGKRRVVEMLAEAGGPMQDANLRDVRITRKNRQVVRANLYKALTQGDLTQDLVLDDGDTIYVPLVTRASNRVYVFGEVDKPGVYPFVEDEMRIADAIAMAGGDTVFAKREHVKVVRGDIDNPQVISVDFKALAEGGDQTQNLALVNGDLIYVPRSFIGDINRFIKQVTPLFRLIIFPAQTVNEYGRASDYLRGDQTNFP
ncbi:hypothetical protein D3OALGB2SA_4615 [Olavius algarvensis associated proteobacterium Delta 3]|nr:hypothetical protein D3OALGB2SA_4615 [Olavius algarvensis associated proteobacterium Delta 3]